MVEDGTTDAAVADATTTDAATTAQPTPLVNAEGVLRDGWRDSLPEDIRSDKVFDRVSNFEGIMKSLSSAERAFGKEKISIPGEASSEAEWTEFHKAGGRPETAGDYNLSRPEELSEEHYSKELATAAQDLFHKIGLSKKQADALFEFNNSAVITQLASNAQNAEAARAQLKNELYSEWGNAFEQKKHFGNVAVEKGSAGNQEFKERLLNTKLADGTRLGDNSDFIRHNSNLGSMFSEAGSLTVEMIPTPGDIQTQIDEAMAHKSHGIDYKDHGFTRDQHDAQVEKVSKLFVEKTKHLKTG
jgi:hypothetical protein